MKRIGKFVPLVSRADSLEEIEKPDEKGLCTDQVALLKTKNSTSGPHRESVKPNCGRLCSALCAMYLGSR